MFLIRGVLIDREHYYASLEKGGVLIEEGALTEGVRYVSNSM